MARIKFDHTSLDTPAFIARMREISTALTGNPVFAALAPRLPAFNTVVDALETRNTTYHATVQLADQQLTERDTERVTAEDAIRVLASASEAETVGEADLLSGGWHLTSPPVPVGAMTAPQNLSGTGGDQAGEADLLWGPVSGRDTYIAEQSGSATGPWTQCYVGKKSSYTVGGLVSGQLYYFRVRAVGSAGPGPWSDIATARAS